MSDSSTLALVLAGGVLTFVTSVTTACVNKWVGKRRAKADLLSVDTKIKADLTDTATKAAEAAVGVMSDAMEALRQDVHALANRHRECELGRKRDRARCDRDRRVDRAHHAKQMAALREELKQHIPDIMAEPVPSYTDVDIQRGARRPRRRVDAA